MLEHQIHPFLYVFLNFLKAFKSQYPLLRAPLLVRALPGEKPCYRFCIAKILLARSSASDITK